MENLDNKPPRASWLRPRLRKYLIKERPKSWAPGNYRKLLLHTDDPPIPALRQSMPPAPPVRSVLTRLQTVPLLPQMEERQTISNSAESKKPEVDHETTKTVHEESDLDKLGSDSESWIKGSPKQEKELPVLI